MMCHDCAATKRPAQGSPVPHYCAACGYPLTSTGARIVKPAASFLVATADVHAGLGHGSEEERALGLSWVAPDPVLVALAAIRRMPT